MSLFSRSLRPSTTDDAVDHYLASLRSRIEPDPLFRRRLRSQAINRFVAASEQLRDLPAPALGQQMGRIGRACLYASVALATSGAGVLGSSQEALPGDPLYGVKLRIEELRFQVIPAHLQGVLSANVLAERLEEMTRLFESGRTADAMALQPAIAAEIEHLVAVEAASGPNAANRIANHLVVVNDLVDRLPAAAEAAVRGAWDAHPGRSGAANGFGPAPPAGAPGGNGGATGGSEGAGGPGGNGGANAGGRIDPGRHEPSPSAPGQANEKDDAQETVAPDRGKSDGAEGSSDQGNMPSPGAERSD